MTDAAALDPPLPGIPPPPLSAGPPPLPGLVRFVGPEWAYWKLRIKGAALLLITLGIYRFWLMTDVRRFLWSNTEIAGETLARDRASGRLFVRDRDPYSDLRRDGDGNTRARPAGLCLRDRRLGAVRRVRRICPL